MKFVSPFGNFKMETPIKWRQIEVQSSSGFDGKIAINHLDTLNFSYGFWSSLLSGNKLLFNWQDSAKYVQAKKYKDKIDGYDAYVITPENNGVNMCRIYIDSLYANGEAITKFDLYGSNLTKENQKLFSKAIKTLKFER